MKYRIEWAFDTDGKHRGRVLYWCGWCFTGARSAARVFVNHQAAEREAKKVREWTMFRFGTRQTIGAAIRSAT